MNYRQSKKMFKRKVYGLKNNDYIIMEYDMDKVSPRGLSYIYSQINKNITINNLILIPKGITMTSMSKNQVKQIRDKLSELLGD